MSGIGDHRYIHGMVRFQEDRRAELAHYRIFEQPKPYAPAVGGVPAGRKARTLAQADAATISQYGGKDR